MLCTTGTEFKRSWKTCDSSSSRSGKHRQCRQQHGNRAINIIDKERLEEGERDTVHTIPQPSATFHITPSMLCMDEIVGKTPLKDLAQIQLVLPWIPSKALHKLQVSVTQEVQSRACTDLAELQQAMEKRDALEIICEQAKFETQEERERMNGLEEKWQELMRRFQRPRRGMNSQQQKRLIRLRRKSINIRRRSRISVSSSHPPLHQQ
jgi:hypothetical protein